LISLEHIEIVKNAAIIEKAIASYGDPIMMESAKKKIRWVNEQLLEISLLKDVCYFCSGSGIDPRTKEECDTCSGIGYFD